MEIERKFLVKKLPDLTNVKNINISQGYLVNEDNLCLRIRKWNDTYFLTYKASCDEAKYGRIEYELPITKDAFLHLTKKIDNHFVEKTRYLIKLDGGLTAELDIYESYLKGLVTVEVEFKDDKEYDSFIIPDWFGKELTGDRNFTNSYLSTLDKWEN